MSEVKRFTMFGQHLQEGDGQFVYASDYDKQAQEIERLRSIISDCAKSCGATVSVECSLDFMAHLPVEIAVVISNLREERDSQQRVCITAMAELAQLKSRQSGVVLPEREQYTKYLAGVIPVNAVEIGGYKDGWNACLDEVARLNSSAVRDGDDPFWKERLAIMFCEQRGIVDKSTNRAGAVDAFISGLEIGLKQAPSQSEQVVGRVHHNADHAEPARAVVNELEQVKKAQTDHSEQDLEVVGAGGTCWMMPTVKQLERAIGSVPSFHELSAELIAPAMLEHLREVISAGEYGDAYRGARDDLLIWKRRALEAEEKAREQDLIIENLGDALNAESGPTFMGEPVVSARGGNDRATLAVPPPIPGTQVLVERELLEGLIDPFCDVSEAHQLACAILSSKGGDV